MLYRVNTLQINCSMISTKGLQAGAQLQKLNIKTLLRQQPSSGGSALLIRVTDTTFALLTRTGARATATRAIALGLRRACVYNL